jgi:hypothetical protein
VEGVNSFFDSLDSFFIKHVPQIRIAWEHFVAG